MAHNTNSDMYVWEAGPNDNNDEFVNDIVANTNENVIQDLNI